MRQTIQRMLFLGIKGTVLALDRATGAEIWRTGLRGSGFVSVSLVGADLIATTRGEMFCLDPASGRIRWHNKLPGLGMGLVTIAPAEPTITTMAEYRQRQQADAAAAGVVAAS
jgi:outer membrane protein assembly factor BamB